MNWQLYWPNWFKLWPYYHVFYDADVDLYGKTFCFGPIQVMWWAING